MVNVVQMCEMLGGAANRKVPPENKKALKSACIAALRAIISGADGRSRTGMEVIRRILSPSASPEASGMQRTLTESSDPKNLV